MLVTVYMPTHNRAKMLETAINSVLAQSYQPIELIVVNDGSQDNTAEVLRRYEKEHGITVITNENAKGACFSRNLAINVARGELITGLDDDDEFLPHHIAQLVAHFDEKYAFVTSPVIENQGTRTIERTLDTGVITLDDMLFYNKAGNQVLTLTERLKAIGGFDENLPAFQDYDIWLRLCEQFGDGLKLSEPTYQLNTAHELNRISSSSQKRLDALDVFTAKHQHLMSPKQQKALQFLRFHISGERLSINDFFTIISSKNYKRVISLFLKQRLPWLKTAIDYFRYKKS
ncbi:glycosyltransferase [Pseudoalteromonas sp. SSM20]|uniref:glycosyltransferase n=1 Tax=Pseudoalteromonas sp. SSM20 TaxID=3139394 RepID=UPI003BAA6CD7